MKTQLLLIAKGFCMGSADVVPGVSGGTMALILGIYSRLINAIKSFDWLWVRSIFKPDIKTVLTRPDFAFLMPLAVGIFFAVLFFTRVISLPGLIRTQPEFIYSLFFGLIIGSIVALMEQVGRLRVHSAITFSAGLVAGLSIVNLAPVNMPDAGWSLFLCGALAAAAMLLPGISGSFILLVLKKYAYIFDAIGHFKFAVILPFALGIAAGLVLFSRLLAWLLDRYYRATVLFILGLLTASLWSVWPFQQRQFERIRQTERLVNADPYLPMTWSNEVGIAIGMMVCGLCIVLILHYIKPTGMTD